MSPEVTIGVLTFGNYPHLARRTIESIREHCDLSAYRLVVGANAVSDDTRAYLETLEASGAIDRLIISSENLNKCPMMRRMLEGVSTEFFWWFDDDSYVVSPDALPDRLRVARGSPQSHVMWGHTFFFGHEQDFSYGTDVVGYVKRAPWYRGLEPPSWNPGGKGETDFEGNGTGDGRWFFITGGCWFMRRRALNDLGWPDPGLIKRNDDVMLCEAIRQQGWECHDIGPCGTEINKEPRRGGGEDQATMEQQMGAPGAPPAAPVRYTGGNLLLWRVAHDMTAQLRGLELIVSDTTAHSYHLLRLHDDQYLFRRVRLRCLLTPLPGATANFYVHHYGDIDVAEIGLDGTIVNRGTCLHLNVEHRPDGRLHVDMEFLNCHPTLSIGCAKDGRRVYAGDGTEQYAIQEIEVEARDATPELSRCPEDERIVLVDVGGQEGLPLQWMLRADRIRPIVFEPLSWEADQLRSTMGRIPGAQVVERALADVSGTRPLCVTAASSCSSLREPNADLLSRYSIAPLFNVVRRVNVDCVRYDELYAQGAVPRPDVIKIDVQGFEFEVLQGFGDLLQSCLGVELEAHLYPIYTGQKLLNDVVALLAEHGLVLRQIRPSSNFDGDLVEVDAFFTRRRDAIPGVTDAQKTKVALLGEVWGLPPV